MAGLRPFSGEGSWGGRNDVSYGAGEMYLRCEFSGQRDLVESVVLSWLVCKCMRWTSDRIKSMPYMCSIKRHMNNRS